MTADWLLTIVWVQVEQLVHCVCHCACPDNNVGHTSISQEEYKSLATTGAVPAMKPEATAVGDPQDGRWKITLMFDGRRFCILKFRYSMLQQMTRQ